MRFIIWMTLFWLSGPTAAVPFLELQQPIDLAPEATQALQLPAPDNDRTVDARLVFFGYTECSDICPMTLVNTNKVIDRAEDIGITIAGIFVTIDPQRDKQAVLDAYFDAFNGQFRYLRTGPENLALLKAVFGIETVEYNRFAGNDQYVIDHSTTSFLIDERNRIVSLIDLSDHGVDPEAVTSDIVTALEGL